MAAKYWLVVLAIAACSSKTPVGVPAKLVVVDAGAQPRRIVRREPALRVPERFEMRTKLAVTGAVTGTMLRTSRARVERPTAVQRGRLEATATTFDGGAAFITYAIEDVGLLDDGEPNAELVREVQRLQHGTGSWELMKNGLERNEKLDPPSHDAIRNAFADVRTEFPETAIGVGATWKTTARRSVGHVVWDLVATYHLTALDAERASLEIDVAMTAADQPLSVEPNATTRLTSGTAHSYGTATVPLHGLVTTLELHESTEINLLIVEHRRRIATSYANEATLTVERLEN